MRILVREPAARDQHAGIDQGLDHRLVGVALRTFFGQDALAGEAGSLVGEAAVGIDSVGDRGVDAAGFEFGFIRRPNIEVFAAVAGRRVDEASAGVVSDVIARKQSYLKIVAADAAQRMRTDELPKH